MKYQVKDYYVKEIADYYGISAQTVRLYDKKGLLPSDKNELNGYRIYTREDIVTMDYICRLKKMHFSLEDIRKIMNEEPLEEAERMFVKQEAKLAVEVEELQRLIGKRAGDFFEYAISEENDCLVCSTYFRKLLKDNGIDFDNFQFTKKEELLISFGRALAKDPKNIPDEIYTELKEEFTEEEIVVITAMGVLMVANNYFNDILKVEV